MQRGTVRPTRWLIVLFLAAVFGASSLSSVPITMYYQVKDLGGGTYQYDFTLHVDNNDNTYQPGQGWRWLIFGDQSSAASPLTNWQISSGQLPVGPWTQMSSSGGGHNGPTFASVSVHWVPSGIGDALHWRGTSTANLAQGQMLWSTISSQLNGATPANFTVATRVDPGIAVIGTRGTAATVPNDETGGGNGFQAGKFTIENNSTISTTVSSIQIEGMGSGAHTSAYTEFAIYRDQTGSGSVGSYDTGDQLIGTGTFSGSPLVSDISVPASEQAFAAGQLRQYFVVVKLNGTASNGETFQYRVSDVTAAGSTTKFGMPSAINQGLVIFTPPEIDVKSPANTSIPVSTTSSLGGVLTTGQSFSYTIENAGPGVLNLTGSPRVVVTPISNVNVSVTNQPATPVAVSGTSTFDLSVQPISATAFSFTVSIANDDPNENPYVFTVSGTGVSNVPPVVSVPSGSNWQANGSNWELLVDPGNSYNDDLDLDDPTPDNINITVTPPGALPPTVTNSPTTVNPAASSYTLNWAGTADATTTPGGYVWQISVSDGISTVNFTATIIVNDLAPVHAAGVDATGGNGQGSATAYAGTLLVGSTTALTLADMTNPNTAQAMTLGTVTPDGGNPAGGSGFGVTLVSDSIVVTPTTALVLADVGTHTFAVDISDAGNTTTVFVSVEVQTPEIDVERNANAIADPGTDTVTGALAGQPTVLTYDITNNGTSDLTITTVVISNLVNCSANVTSSPATTVTPTNATSFQITVTPGVAAFSFDIDINNDDVDENPYDIAVSGNAAAAPEIDVSKGAVPVADGASDTVANPRTGIPNSVTYTITNNGTSDLSVSGVSIGGLSNCTANVTSTPAGTVTPGNSTSFTVEFTPTADGPFSFTIAIANDDANENPYDINVNGTAATTGTVLNGGGGGGGGCASGSTSSTGALALLVALMLGAAVYRRRRA